MAQSVGGGRFPFESLAADIKLCILTYLDDTRTDLVSKSLNKLTYECFVAANLSPTMLFKLFPKYTRLSTLTIEESPETLGRINDIIHRLEDTSIPCLPQLRELFVSDNSIPAEIFVAFMNRVASYIRVLVCHVRYVPLLPVMPKLEHLQLDWDLGESEHMTGLAERVPNLSKLISTDVLPSLELDTDDIDDSNERKFDGTFVTPYKDQLIAFKNIEQVDLCFVGLPSLKGDRYLQDLVECATQLPSLKSVILPRRAIFSARGTISAVLKSLQTIIKSCPDARIRSMLLSAQVRSGSEVDSIVSHIIRISPDIAKWWMRHPDLAVDELIANHHYASPLLTCMQWKHLDLLDIGIARLDSSTVERIANSTGLADGLLECLGGAQDLPRFIAFEKIGWLKFESITELVAELVSDDMEDDEEEFSAILDHILQGYWLTRMSEIVSGFCANVSQFRELLEDGTLSFDSILGRSEKHLEILLMLAEDRGFGGDGTEVQMLELLAQHGIDLRAVDPITGRDFLIECARRGCSKFISQAVTIGKLDVNAHRDGFGRTALHYAEDPATLDALLHHGGDLLIIDNDGNTPIDVIVSGGKRRILPLVQSKHIDSQLAVDVASRVEDNAIWDAALKAAKRTLVSVPSEPKLLIMAIQMRKFLHVASFVGDIKHNVVNKLDDTFGTAPIHEACRVLASHEPVGLKIFTLVSGVGGNVNLLDSNGKTGLMHFLSALAESTVERKFADLQPALLQLSIKGAKITTPTTGPSPLNIIIRIPNEEVSVELIRYFYPEGIIIPNKDAIIREACDLAASLNKNSVLAALKALQTAQKPKYIF